MKKIAILLGVIFFAGCAVQTPQMKDAEPAPTLEEQRLSQAEMMKKTAPEKLSLKRKVAVGRLSNETNYGRSLLHENEVDQLGKKVTDMFLQALTNSDNFLVF